MFLHISDQMLVEEIQDRFHECFPALEIVFYSAISSGTPAVSAGAIDKRNRIAHIRRYHYNGALEIKSWFTAAKVRQDIKILFDLHAQIFRTGASGRLKVLPPSDRLS